MKYAFAISLAFWVVLWFLGVFWQALGLSTLAVAAIVFWSFFENAGQRR